MKSFAKLVGMLPFIGKMLIRPYVFNLYQSTRGEERRWSYVYLMVLLVLLTLFHGVLAKMGIRALSFDSPIWVKAISALYTITNICVILSQIYLGFRATCFFLRARENRAWRNDTGYSAAEAVTMIAVTLAGQIIFFSLYLWYS
ncbi:MAG: hypothetical protein AAB587_01455 [Patescibacteria group bacterium]